MRLTINKWILQDPNSFGGGDIDKFKYHMVKWEKVCVAEDFGDLGIMNTRKLNEALLMKWI